MTPLRITYVLLLFTLTSCSANLLRTWNVERYERATLGKQGMAVSTITFMKNGVIFDYNPTKALVSRADLLGKLREVNVLQLSQVNALVFDTTRDVSVLHSTDNIIIDPIIMKDISTFLTI